MSFYWSLKNVPELADLSPKRRKRAHEACMRKYFLDAPLTRRSAGAFALLLVCSISSFIFGESIPRIFGVHKSLLILYGVTYCGFGVGWFLMTRLAIPAIRPFYHKFINRELHDHDA